MRAAWRRDLDRVDTVDRASNLNCPICEGYVWTHAPGKSYTVYNGENYHPDCLIEQGIETEAASPAQTGLAAVTADRNYSGSDTSKITDATEVTK